MGGATWVELGDLLEMRAGKFLSASEIGEKQTRERSIPCYGANGVRGYTSEANNFDSRVLIGRQGALSGNVHLAAAPFYATDHAVVCNPRSYLELNFFYHVLSHAHLGQYVTKSAQPGLSVRRLKTVRVPVPPMETQRRIANVLDKFDTLVNDLSSGLPAEIEARRKQYEYYRDKLLTFKELEAAAA